MNNKIQDIVSTYEPKWIWLQSLRTRRFYRYEQYLLVIKNRIFLMFKTYGSNHRKQIWQGIELENKEVFFKGNMPWKEVLRLGNWTIKVIFMNNKPTIYRTINKKVNEDFINNQFPKGNVSLAEITAELRAELLSDSEDYSAVIDKHYPDKKLINGSVWFFDDDDDDEDDDDDDNYNDSDGYHGEGVYRNKYGVDVFYND